MSEYVGKVGKKGELYMPGELIIKKGKRVSDLLMEDTIAKVTVKEMGEIRKKLEKEIIEIYKKEKP